MSGDDPSLSPQEFLAVAQREGLLAPELADTLSRESAQRRIPPAQLAMQKGFLSLVQIEIIETLLHPKHAIRGYEILGLLGYGGMGVVYRARQLSLGRIVALKTVMLGTNANPSRLSRFQQEAQTVGRLLHPHIVTAYDFGQDGGRLYFAMELVEGEDVEQRLDHGGAFSEAMTWGLIRQAAAGLAQAAELGVVHRDIKPANLLLVTPPKGFPLPAGMPLVKIADFGLALVTDDVDDRTRLTADNTTVGSPQYMAPEQLSGREIDLRADIYALGATAYHMLSGRPPFDELSLPQIFAQKLHADPAPLVGLCSGLSRDSVALVDDLMARDPARRIASYAQLIDRIDLLLPVSQHVPAVTLAARTSLSTETRRWGETLTSADVFPKPDSGVIPSTERRRLYEVGWRILVAGLLLGAVYYGVVQWRQSGLATAVRPGMELKPSGYASELFDGESIGKFRPFSGDWQTRLDHEGSVVLAASHGLVTRRVQRDEPGGDPQRLEYYRLRFNVALPETTAAELSFGIHALQRDVEARSVLRLEHDQVTLGRQVADTLRGASPVKMSLAPEHYYEVRIERQTNEWRAYVNDQLIGTTPLASDEYPIFRLAVVTQGSNQYAYFADFLLEELIPP